MYTLLAFCTIFSFLISNFNDKRRKYKFPLFVIYGIPLFLFVLTYALRDGWCQDFTIYQDVYNHKNLYQGKYEFLFSSLFDFCKQIKFSFNSVLFILSSIFILGFFYFSKQFRPYIGIIYTILFTLTITFIANNIRFSTASGFIFASLPFLQEKKWLPFSILSVCAVLFHSATILLIGIILAFYFFNPFRKFYILISFYILSLFVSAEILGLQFINLFNLIGNVGISSDLTIMAYIQNETVTEKYFAGERIELGAQSFSIFYQATTFIFNIWSLYLGWNLARKSHKREITLYFNLYALAVILEHPSSGFELMLRFVTFFKIFASVVWVFVIQDLYKRKKFILTIIFILFIILNFYRSLNFLFSNYDLKYIF